MVRSVFFGAGYRRADNRCSGGEFQEEDLLGCKHCLALIRKKEWQADGGFCHCCNAPICNDCAKLAVKEGCAPFLQGLEKAINDKYRREQNARMMGL